MNTRLNTRLMFRPDLNDCILEERALLAVNNLGIIIMTTSGLALITPFPGANASGAGSLGSNGSGGGSAASVSGLPQPTSFYITGSGGMSSLKPGNITGLPEFGGGCGGAAAGGIQHPDRLGSGHRQRASRAGAPMGVPRITLWVSSQLPTRRGGRRPRSSAARVQPPVQRCFRRDSPITTRPRCLRRRPWA